MQPSLRSGWLVVGLSVQPQTGQIAVAQVGDSEVIKRVQSVASTGLILVGDNLKQTSSYRISRSQIKGRCIFCLWPLRRVK